MTKKERTIKIPKQKGKKGFNREEQRSRSITNRKKQQILKYEILKNDLVYIVF